MFPAVAGVILATMQQSIFFISVPRSGGGDPGLVVIPTVRSSTDKRSLDWFLEGEPANAIIAYSSMWTTDNTENKDYEINVIEYEQMIKELKPTRILLYGELREYMKKEKSIITQIEIFTESRWG